MNLDNFDNYVRPATTGIDAFEQDYANVEVIFERLDGTFIAWNANPFEYMPEAYAEGLPEGISINYIKDTYFELVQLAAELGFRSAWGMDH
jgi:hypothetical protein